MRGLFNVPYHEDESVISMWSRLSTANGTKARLFSMDMSVNHYDLAKGEPGALARMAEVTALHPDFLAARSLVRLEAKNTTLAGHRFPSHNAIARTTTRFCPHCLQEDDARDHRFPQARRYFRLRWHLRAVRSCPYHNCMIVEGPDPENPDLNIDFSRYNRDYAKEIRRTTAEAVPLPFSSFEKFACDRLVGIKGHGDFLDEISLSLAIDLIEETGICLRYGKTFDRRDKLSETELHSVSEDAFQRISRGYGGLDDCLDLISGSDDTYNPRVGGTKLYGSLYLRIANRREPEDRSAYDALRKHALRNFPLSNRARVFGPLLESKLVSLPTWTKEHEVHHTTFRRLLKTLGHEQALVDSEGREPLINVDIAKKVLAYWRNLTTAAELERILGVGIDTMRVIQREGLLVPTLPKERNNRYAKYSHSDVETFLKKVIPEVPTSDIEGLYSFRSAVRRAHTGQGVVLRLLLDGRVTRRGIDPTHPNGIDALLLDPTELQDLIAERMAPGVKPADIMSIEQSAQYLQVGPDMVKRLIWNRLLPDVRLSIIDAASKNFGRGILRVDLEDFRSRYVSLEEIAKRYDFGRRKLHSLLLECAPDVKSKFPANIRTVFLNRRIAEDPEVVAAFEKQIARSINRRRPKSACPVTEDQFNQRTTKSA
ncbi:TniQ family protein [Rhizobium leguminosarum]|uniref:TniQ family protein n=1 Tax=Rhizobium leguminosarum TaxID=384 RepID=UPI001C93FB4E|nr:TniQ family protein [Rhizobium leguminosarum]MBY5705699.1 TniQ family protein [Rhizobium leguminosarum]